VDVKVRKAADILWAFRRNCGATWGQRPNVLAHWFFSIVGGLVLRRLVLNKAKQSTKTCILGITGAMHTTTNGGMESLTGLPSLQLVNKCEAR
jgi:hypothetical protein